MFIHNSPLGYHGNLRSTKCLIDGRFVLRISGFGLHHFRKTDSAAAPEKKSRSKYFQGTECYTTCKVTP